MARVCILLLLSFAAFSAAPPVCPAQTPATGPPPPKILLLNSYHQGYVWSDSLVAGLQSVLRASPLDPRLDIQYMDTKRRLSPDYLDALRDFLLRKYGSISLDLVVAADDNALDFVLQNRADFFPDVPVVFCGIGRYDPERLAGQKNITGVVAVPHLRETLEIILDLHPDTESVLCLHDQTAAGIASAEHMRTMEASFSERLHFYYLSDVSAVELKSHLRGQPVNTVVLLGVYMRDKRGRVFTVDETKALVHDNCPVPVYGCFDYFLDGGVVGGRLISAGGQGRAAGEKVLRILGGESTDTIPVGGQDLSRMMFDWLELERWEVDQAELPDNAVVINRPFSFYSEYRGRLLVAGSVFMVLIGLVIGLTVSIGHRRRAEARLSASETRTRALIDRSPLGTIIASEDGAVEYVNARCQEMFGYSADEIPTLEAWRKLAYPNEAYRQEVAEIWRENFATHRSRNNSSGPFEFDVICADGSKLRVEFHAARIGRQRLLLLNDVTGRQHLEEQLRHSQKMDAVGQLAGGIAHDFNNLLQVIKGHADLLCLDLEADSSPRESVDVILDASVRATSLIRQLLTFSRSEKLQSIPVHLDEVITGLERMLQRTLGEHVELTVKRTAFLPPVHADPSQLEQVLVNLCINARDAMPLGGRIGISTDVCALDEQFCSSRPWAKPGTFVRLSVADTGPGIPADAQPYIFDPFFTTKNVGKGSGLGLATVYAIVQRHSGIVDFESGENGTVFHIYFPRSHMELPLPEQETATVTLHGRRELVLIVEDDKLVRKLTRRILEEANYEVATAGDGRAAQKMIRDEGLAPDMIVVDAVMPKMGGHEFCTWLHKAGHSTPTLLVSGYDCDALDKGDSTVEADDMLSKPFDRNELLSIVHGLINRADEPAPEEPAKTSV